MSIKLWLCMACRAPSSPPTPPLYLQKKTPGQVFAPALKERESKNKVVMHSLAQLNRITYSSSTKSVQIGTVFGQLEIKLTS